MATITKAKLQDLNTIAYMTLALEEERKLHFANSTAPLHEKDQNDDPIQKIGTIVMKAVRQGLLFIALSNRDIIGFIQGSIYEQQTHATKRIGSIDNLFIQKQYRRNGIAQQLLERLEQRFQECACHHLTLCTDAENKSAQELYTKSGYTPMTIEFCKTLP